MATISNTPRPGYVWDSTDNVWYPIGTGPHTHADYITSGSAINPNIVDAKGDIIAATAADTVARLAVGSNNTVLTADSSTATGLKWATVAGYDPDYQLLNSGGTALTGASSITISGISNKKDLLIRITNASSNSGGLSTFTIRFNSDTANNYYGIGFGADGVDTPSFLNNGLTDSIDFGREDGGTQTRHALIHITGCNTTGVKPFISATKTNATTFDRQRFFNGFYQGTSAITSVTIACSAGNLDNGTIWVYGA
jgi:hypothetical protein